MQVRGLEAEIFGEMKGVGPAPDGSPRIEIGGVPSPHGRELVTQRLGEQAILHSAVVAPPDELFFQALVDALSVSEARRGEHPKKRGTQHAPRPNMPEHWLKR